MSSTQKILEKKDLSHLDLLYPNFGYDGYENLETPQYLDGCLKYFFQEAAQGSIDFLSDFILKSGIDGKEHKAHKVILACRSDYFVGLFRSKHDTSSLTLDYPSPVIAACLHGIYTGETLLTKDSAQDVFLAADYLNMHEVVKQAIGFLSLHM